MRARPEIFAKRMIDLCRTCTTRLRRRGFLDRRDDDSWRPRLRRAPDPVGSSYRAAGRDRARVERVGGANRVDESWPEFAVRWEMTTKPTALLDGLVDVSLLMASPTGFGTAG